RVIQEAAPKGVMSSYNDWDGLPVTGSSYFLTELLRKQYGFKGYVVSDSEAVEFLFTKHHVAKDAKDAVRLAFLAGLNVRTNFTSPADYILPLRELLKEGKLSIDMLNSRVGDVLRVKFEIGLFDSPYVKDPAAADKIVHTKADEEFATQINRESLVLLKNANSILPLQKSKLQKVLVTGPLASVSNYQMSRYGPSNNQTISVLQGIKTYLGKDVNVDFAKGCDIVDKTWPESEIILTPLTADEEASIADAVAKALQSDVIIAVVGEDEKRVGESLSRTGLGLPGRQLNLVQALVATKKPVILVLINGQPLTINWENRNVDAILEAWFPAGQGGTVVAEALFGEYNPGGKLSVTFPKTTGQIELNFPFKKGSHNGQPGDGPNGYGNTAVVGALYPFGYGLSYTSFQYKNLHISPVTQASQGNFTVSLEVTNTGKVKGDEVVQLYIKDLVSSVTTYESVLRGFERVNLLPGETKKVEFLIEPTALEKLDVNMNWTVEPGMYQIMIGSSSEDIKLTSEINITQ
ncbi:MAG: glycoside hydrolase family 3 C-terminal domain-containing protein, partial [Oligoflexus sp.]|nr:glycoside hydrolase family 3 C-terminal domain-containing protein [Pseudopedobacter sp.]